MLLRAALTACVRGRAWLRPAPRARVRRRRMSPPPSPTLCEINLSTSREAFTLRTHALSLAAHVASRPLIKILWCSQARPRSRPERQEPLPIRIRCCRRLCGPRCARDQHVSERDHMCRSDRSTHCTPPCVANGSAFCWAPVLVWLVGGSKYCTRVQLRKRKNRAFPRPRAGFPVRR